jgi:hypothetical protein
MRASSRTRPERRLTKSAKIATFTMLASFSPDYSPGVRLAACGGEKSPERFARVAGGEGSAEARDAEHHAWDGEASEPASEGVEQPVGGGGQWPEAERHEWLYTALV